MCFAECDGYTADDVVDCNPTPFGEDEINIYGTNPTDPTDDIITIGSGPTKFEKNKRVGLEDVGIAVYPNPASDYLVVETNLPLYNVQVFNLAGELVQQVSSKTNTRMELDIKGLTGGLYLVKVTGHNNIETFKININN